MLQHIATALSGSVQRPDRAPVRRHSHLAGRCEGVFWRRTDRRDVRRVMLAARRYELATRATGRRNGALGHVALELLGNLVSFKTGRLEPALAYLMRTLRRSKDAVVRALAALRAHGFLDWLRRFERVEAEGAGPRIRQVSNAYRLVLPARAARLLGAGVPLPDDVVQDVEERRGDLAQAKAGLSLDELAVVEVENTALGRALAQLGRLVQGRESATQTETQTTLFP